LPIANSNTLCTTDGGIGQFPVCGSLSVPTADFRYHDAQYQLFMRISITKIAEDLHLLGRSLLARWLRRHGCNRGWIKQGSQVAQRLRKWHFSFGVGRVQLEVAALPLFENRHPQLGYREGLRVP